jgi:hypothetical protein
LDKNSVKIIFKELEEKNKELNKWINERKNLKKDNKDYSLVISM